MITKREPESIALRVERKDGKDVVYAVMDWPELTNIVLGILDEDNEYICQNENGDVVVTVANGVAVYRRAKEQPSPYSIALELCNSSWSPAPLLEAVQTPEARAGRERLREIFKDRS